MIISYSFEDAILCLNHWSKFREGFSFSCTLQLNKEGRLGQLQLVLVAGKAAEMEGAVLPKMSHMFSSWG